MVFLTNIKENRNLPTVQFPNNTTMNATKTGILTPSISLRTQAKNVHIFDVLHIASLISWVKLYDDYFFFFFWSGLQCPKAYSLWGGVVPSPSIG